MKSRIFSALISILAAFSALACYSPTYLNKDLAIFRAFPDTQSRANPRHVCQRDENLDLWIEAIGGAISRDDVATIVYKTSLDSLKRLSSADSNPFARRLLAPDNKDMYQILLVAKEVEELRAKMQGDPWYYPTDDDAYHTALNRLYKAGIEGMTGRMAPRYAVQVARILREKGDFRGIIEFWDKYGNRLPDNVLRRMVADYVGGAYEMLGDTENARRMYTEAQNIEALGLVRASIGGLQPPCADSADLQGLMNLFAFDPNHPVLRELLYKIVSDYEYSIKYYFSDNWEEPKAGASAMVPIKRLENYNIYRQLCDFAEKAVTDPRLEDRAFWHYAIAFIAYLDGSYSTAANHLRAAERLVDNDFDSESIRAFRILFDSTTRSLSRRQWLENLCWLDKKLMAEESASDSEYATFSIRSGYSISYWSDVVRRVCESAADHLDRRGDHVLALQLRNYSNYRNLQAADTLSTWTYHKNQWHQHKARYPEIRRYWHSDNEFDYCNSFFESFDALPAARGAEFVNHVLNPSDALDQFFAERGYYDSDYLCEHVGTLYLREMDYANASNWLRKVAGTYQKGTNIQRYMTLDPFQWLDVDHKIADNRDYKLLFAIEMQDLERKISLSKDPNDRADARLRYAIGLRNSFGRCWALTHYSLYADDVDINDEEEHGSIYGRTSSYRGAFIKDPRSRRAYEKYDQLVSRALREYTSPDRLAMAHLQMKNYKTVMERYASTKAAQSIRGHCDTYTDYALHRW